MQSGIVYWITGLSGSGKTTIGNMLYYKLREERDNVVILDGDILKEIVGKSGYSTEERKQRAYKYSNMCKMLADQGITVICCTIAMYDEVRQWNRDNISSYVEIYLDVPMELLIKRDQKGLYSRYNNGVINNLAGMDIEVETPKNPDIVFNNDGTKNVKQIVKEIKEYKPKDGDDYDRDTEYWNDYYKNRKEIEPPTEFAKSVSDFILDECKKEESILTEKKLMDIGCGNGRDSRYFAGLGLNVIGVDAAKEAISELSEEFDNSNITFVCDDFVKSKTLYQIGYDYCYSRFSLHAISAKQQHILLKNIYTCLKKSGLLFIEVRGISDTLYGKGKQVSKNAFIYNGHYRRFADKDELKDELENIGFDIEYAEESSGFAIYKDEDPVAIRIICRKANYND